MIRINRRDAGEIVVVDWVDSCRGDSCWQTDDTARKLSIADCQTAGHLVSVDRRQVTIAHSRSETPFVCPWGAPICIPRVAITGYRVVRKSTKRR
jgi:hypothetical protein